MSAKTILSRVCLEFRAVCRVAGRESCVAIPMDPSEAPTDALDDEDDGCTVVGMLDKKPCPCDLYDGEPYDKGSGDHQEFRYDAWRVIAMVASDLEWFGKDEAGTWAVEFANKYLQFFYDEGIDSYGSLYTLNGTCASTTHSAGLVAMVT